MSIKYEQEKQSMYDDLELIDVEKLIKANERTDKTQKVKLVTNFHPSGREVSFNREKLIKFKKRQKNGRDSLVTDWRYVNEIFSVIIKAIAPDVTLKSILAGTVIETVEDFVTFVLDNPGEWIFIKIGDYLLKSGHDLIQAAKIMKLLGDDDPVAHAYIRVLFEPIMLENIQKMWIVPPRNVTKMEVAQWLSRAPSVDSSINRFMSKFIYYLPGYVGDFK